MVSEARTAECRVIVLEEHEPGSLPFTAEAQAFFEAAGGPRRDPHRLDVDGDGQACEGLP